MEHLHIWEMCVFSSLFIFLASKDYVLLYVNFFFWGEEILDLFFFFKVICSISERNEWISFSHFLGAGVVMIADPHWENILLSRRLLGLNSFV